MFINLFQQFSKSTLSFAETAESGQIGGGIAGGGSGWLWFMGGGGTCGLSSPICAASCIAAAI